MIEEGAPSVPFATLHATGRKARYGVSFIQAICNEAGVPTTEPPPDADVRAIDLNVAFPEGDVHVQVKCTQKRSVPTAQFLSWPIEQGWVDKWARFRNPVYFVVVRVVPDSRGGWVQHGTTHTVHRAHAVWTRIDTSGLGRSIRVPLANRFSAGTLAAWHADYRLSYETGGLR